ncbi:alkene reductase [Sphingomonas sp. ID0503]|uniref:alkene reductase n=1 Tax=Sphingomonas sp. ID0503 TaxID=3399691 RepID=UPI003AFABC3F
MPGLFDPIEVGAITAPNRVFMAPLTRARGTRDHVPTPIMAEYYAQRASAGLIISEAIGISRQGLGWPYATGIWTDEQVAGWRRVTDAVHAAGGRIVAQLWHMGRLIHTDLLDGELPVSSSAIAAPGHAHTYDGNKPYPVPRPLEAKEVPQLLEDYRHAARNALAAGFDGVQLHAANGYLIDSFLRDNTNNRTDSYGGSIENRIRLLGEVTRAIVEVVGAERTGVRLSPNGEVQGVNDSDPHALFPAAAKLLEEIGIAFLELREPDFNGSRGAADVEPVAPEIRKVFSRTLILNSDYDRAKADAALSSGAADAIAFGRPFIANPDLPRRLAEGLPYNPLREAFLYSQGEEGYTDYPAAQEAKAA